MCWRRSRRRGHRPSPWSVVVVSIKYGRYYGMVVAMSAHLSLMTDRRILFFLTDLSVVPISGQRNVDDGQTNFVLFDLSVRRYKNLAGDRRPFATRSYDTYYRSHMVAGCRRTMTVDRSWQPAVLLLVHSRPCTTSK